MLNLQQFYALLLELAAELGYRMMCTGAEVYRVEESVQRVLQAYGVESGEIFAIPSCINVSLTDPDGQSSTRIRRIPPHSTDLDLLVAYNELCRQVCQSPPPLEDGLEPPQAVSTIAVARDNAKMRSLLFIQNNLSSLIRN